MKGYLIDSVYQTVTEVEIPNNSPERLKFLQKSVGGYIEVGHRFPNEDVIFVDDEGLLKAYPTAFYVMGGIQPLAGNGIMVGTNNKGDSISVQTPIEDVIEQIAWLTAKP